jgi:uncharacterized protein (DUF952 family)
VPEILHITTPAAWAEAGRTGSVVADSLDTEGFVHCSTRDQLAGTLARHFAGAGELVVLVLDPDAIPAALRWEESRPGERYPHVYGPIPVAAVRAVETAAA